MSLLASDKLNKKETRTKFLVFFFILMASLDIFIFEIMQHNIPHFNQFLANVPILYPLKTPENQRFSYVFRGSKIGALARNGSIHYFYFICIWNA